MSSLMDLQAALGGGGPGGPPGPGLAPAGPPPGPAPPDDTGAGGEQYGTSLDALDGAEEALHAFIQLDPDEVDRAQAGQALTIVLKLKAANQKSVQSGDLKSLQRALAGGGGAPPPGGLGA